MLLPVARRHSPVRNVGDSSAPRRAQPAVFRSFLQPHHSRCPATDHHKLDCHCSSRLNLRSVVNPMEITSERFHIPRISSDPRCVVQRHPSCHDAQLDVGSDVVAVKQPLLLAGLIIVLLDDAIGRSGAPTE